MDRTSTPDALPGALRGALGRRWPWLLAAALAGAAAGAGVAWGARRVHTQDPPEAQEPEQLRAVVDRPDDR